MPGSEGGAWVVISIGDLPRTPRRLVSFASALLACNARPPEWPFGLFGPRTVAFFPPEFPFITKSSSSLLIAPYHVRSNHAPYQRPGSLYQLHTSPPHDPYEALRGRSRSDAHSGGPFRFKVRALMGASAFDRMRPIIGAVKKWLPTFTITTATTPHPHHFHCRVPHHPHHPYITTRTMSSSTLVHPASPHSVTATANH